MQGADYATNSKGERIIDTKELQDKIRQQLIYLSSKKPIHPDILNLSDKIDQAIVGVNMSREKGENIPTDQFARYDKENLQHFLLGLNYIKDANPGQYKNIVRGIEEKGKIADLDFEQIANAGQWIYNRQIFREGAVNPEAIGKETNLDYTTYQTKKADYARILSEAYIS